MCRVSSADLAHQLQAACQQELPAGEVATVLVAVDNDDDAAKVSRLTRRQPCQTAIHALPVNLSNMDEGTYTSSFFAHLGCSCSCSHDASEHVVCAGGAQEVANELLRQAGPAAAVIARSVALLDARACPSKASALAAAGAVLAAASRLGAVTATAAGAVDPRLYVSAVDHQHNFPAALLATKRQAWTVHAASKPDVDAWTATVQHKTDHIGAEQAPWYSYYPDVVLVMADSEHSPVLEDVRLALEAPGLPYDVPLLVVVPEKAQADVAYPFQVVHALALLQNGPHVDHECALLSPADTDVHSQLRELCLSALVWGV